MRLGLTTRASCLLAAGLTAVLCGMGLGEIDLVRAGCLAAAVPLASAMVVARSRLSVTNRRAIQPPRVPAGASVDVHLTVANRSVLPTGPLMLEDRLPTGTGRARFVLDGLGSREARTVVYHLGGLGRGRYSVGPLRMRLTDPFGMIDLSRSFTATSQFLVNPVVDTLPPGQPPQSLDVGENAGSHAIGSRGADDAATREYRMGDDLRKIHWRSTARLGTLMVRHEERPWQGQATVLLDLRNSAHVLGAVPAGADARLSNSLEWAVSAAASIGSHLMLAGRDVGLLTEQAATERLKFGEPGRLADYLAEVAPTRGRDLSPVSGALRNAARDSAVVAILGIVDTASLRALSEAHPPGSATRGMAILLDVPTWLGDDHRTELDPPQLTAESAARVLRASGWWVAIAVRGERIGDVYRRLLSQRAAAGAVRVR